MQATVLPELDHLTVFPRMQTTPPAEVEKSNSDHIATGSTNAIDAPQGHKGVYRQNRS